MRGMYTNIGAGPWHPAGWVIYHNSEGDSGIHTVVILPIRYAMFTHLNANHSL